MNTASVVTMRARMRLWEIISESEGGTLQFEIGICDDLIIMGWRLWF